MQKTIFFLFSLLIIVSCSRSDDKMETGIYLTQTKIQRVDSSSTFGMVNTRHIYFRRGFWKFLFKDYPNAASLMFPGDTAYTWGKTDFGITDDGYVDKRNPYRVMKLDSLLLTRINRRLPNSPYELEESDTTRQHGIFRTKDERKAFGPGIIKDFNQLKRILSDSEYNEVEINCTESMLNKIISHKYD